MDEHVQARFGGSTSSLTMSVETMEKTSLSPPRKVVIPHENLRTQRKLHRVMKFMQTISSGKELTGMDMDNGLPFNEILISNFKREEQQIL